MHVIAPEKHKQNVRLRNSPRNIERLAGDFVERNKILAVIATLKA